MSRTGPTAELSPHTLEMLADLGNFSPTVNVQDRQMKGYMLDRDGEAYKTYWSSSDMRRIAEDLIEAANWLDACAEQPPEGAPTNSRGPA